LIPKKAMPSKSSPTSKKHARWEKGVAILLGVWVALVLLKLGNPVILEDFLGQPGTALEVLINSWPFNWGIGLLALALLAGAMVWRWQTHVPKWALGLPLLWFGWQLLSAIQTVDMGLTGVTVVHFGACLACYYLGVFALSRVQALSPFWMGLLVSFVIILWVGIEQHFGGLENTRRFMEEIRWDDYPPEFREKLDTPEFRRKMASDRIFSTLVYPNALAGAILMLLPVSLAFLWTSCQHRPRAIQYGLVAVLAGTGLACLYWSQSKAGWLIALGMGLMAFWRLRLSSRIKLLVVLAVMVGGLGAFFVRYSAYFERGATSVVARFDYWQAAVQVIKTEPILGSGPGTFKVRYKSLKAPESEMTRLAHNDYLQQGSDSGLVGFVLYLTFIWGSVWVLYRRSCQSSNWRFLFPIWLGIAGLATQSWLEFSLYIPALAWLFFLLLGWLWGTAVPRNDLDIPTKGG